MLAVPLLAKLTGVSKVAPLGKTVVGLESRKNRAVLDRGPWSLSPGTEDDIVNGGRLDDVVDRRELVERESIR